MAKGIKKYFSLLDELGKYINAVIEVQQTSEEGTLSDETIALIRSLSDNPSIDSDFEMWINLIRSMKKIGGSIDLSIVFFDQYFNLAILLKIIEMAGICTGTETDEEIKIKIANFMKDVKYSYSLERSRKGSWVLVAWFNITSPLVIYSRNYCKGERVEINATDEELFPYSEGINIEDSACLKFLHDSGYPITNNVDTIVQFYMRRKSCFKKYSGHKDKLVSASEYEKTSKDSLFFLVKNIILSNCKVNSKI